MIDIDYTHLNYLDITIASLVVILSIKGFVNGLLKELFGLSGLIGAIFIGSRNSQEAGDYIYKNIYQLDNNLLLNFLGFVSIFIIVWTLASILGELVAKLASRYSKKGLISRLAGSFIGGGKYFLLFSVVIVSLLNVEFIKDNSKKILDLNRSILYPYINEYGSQIINLKEMSSFNIKAVKLNKIKEENNQEIKSESLVVEEVEELDRNREKSIEDKNSTINTILIK